MGKLEKKKKIIIVAVAAVLVIVAIVCVILFNKSEPAQPEPETEIVAVTDENGEPVTDENGEPVTEVAMQDTTTASGAATASGSAGETTTKSEPIKKPSAPKAVTGLKAGTVTEDSIEISWDKTDCSGYQISYSSDNATWNYYPASNALSSSPYTSTSFKLTKLEAYTTYYFSVRAYNYNEAGVSTSSWTQTLSVRTSELKTARKITFTVKLPMDSSKDDTLVLWIGNEKVYEGTVALNSTEFTYTTEKEYKGEVTAWAELKGAGISKSQPTGNSRVDFDLSSIGIDNVDIGEIG